MNAETAAVVAEVRLCEDAGSCSKCPRLDASPRCVGGGIPEIARRAIVALAAENDALRAVAAARLEAQVREAGDA
jgi:hypothetical protein